MYAPFKIHRGLALALRRPPSANRPSVKNLNELRDFEQNAHRRKSILVLQAKGSDGDFDRFFEKIKGQVGQAGGLMFPALLVIASFFSIQWLFKILSGLFLFLFIAPVVGAVGFKLWFSAKTIEGSCPTCKSPVRIIVTSQIESATLSSSLSSLPSSICLPHCLPLHPSLCIPPSLPPSTIFSVSHSLAPSRTSRPALVHCLRHLHSLQVVVLKSSTGECSTCGAALVADETTISRASIYNVRTVIHCNYLF